MSLEQIGQKIKSLAGVRAFLDNLYKIGLFFGLILIIGNGYVWFVIAHLEKPNPIQVVKGLELNFEIDPMSVDLSDEGSSSNPAGTKNSPKGNIVASKNGAKYYFLHCSGVKRIKNDNKIYFRSVEEAQKAGFSIASGCKE